MSSSAVTIVDGTALLVSTWTYLLTWGICAMQLATYWNNRLKDHALLQIAVFGLFINETIWTVMRCIAAHRHILGSLSSSTDDFSFPRTTVRIQMISCYFANITLMGVNLFLIYRYHRLTKRWWLAIPLAVVACLSVSFHFWANTMALKAIDIVMTREVDFVALTKAAADSTRASKIASLAEFTIVATTYILLLVELITYLRRDLLSGKQVLRRLIFMTVESGLVTFALTAALAVLAWKTTANFTMSILIACCARAYYHTMLFNLNMRSSSSSVMRDREPGLSHLLGTLRTRDGDSTGALQGTPLQSVSVTYHTATKCDIHDDKSGPLMDRVGSL